MEIIWKYRIEWARAMPPLITSAKEGYLENIGFIEALEYVHRVAETTFKKQKARFLSEVLLSKFYVSHPKDDTDFCGEHSGEGGSMFSWRHNDPKELPVAIFFALKAAREAPQPPPIDPLKPKPNIRPCSPAQKSSAT